MLWQHIVRAILTKKKKKTKKPQNVLMITSGPGCSKLPILLVNIYDEISNIISEKRQYFLLKKCEKLLHCKSSYHFFFYNKKYQCIW